VQPLPFFLVCFVQPVLKQLEAQPFPLYVAVLMKDVVTWKSSYDVVGVNLPETTEAAFNVLLNSMEIQLGAVFVSHALVYITVTHNGLSEVGFHRRCKPFLLTVFIFCVKTHFSFYLS